MTTGVFEVTNQQGRTFLVDLKGKIWKDRDEFLDNNELYSDKGILLMPKNLEVAGPGHETQYEAVAGRNRSFMERWVAASGATAKANAPVIVG